MTAKFSHARRKVKIAAGVAKATSRTNFGLITTQGEIAAACSRNGFLGVPFLKKQTQFYAVFSPKTAVCQIQSQFKANSNPIQTQSCHGEAQRRRIAGLLDLSRRSSEGTKTDTDYWTCPPKPRRRRILN